MKVATLLAASALVSAAAAAPTYVTADHMIDTATGTVIHKAAVVVDGGKVVAAGEAAKVAAPDGATRLDLGNKTLLPGLIDLHVHLSGDATKHGYAGLENSAMRYGFFAVKSAKDTLLAGFTTVRDVGDNGYVVVDLAQAIEAGDITGPRVIASGPALGATGGHCDEGLLPREFKVFGESVADGPWAIRAQIRKNHKYGSKVIKFCATGGVLSKGDTVGGQQYTLEEMQALVAEAHQLGLRVAVHAHGTSGIADAIRAGADTIEHVSLIDDTGIKLAKEKGTFLNFDIYNDDYIMAMGEKAGFLPESLEKEKMIAAAQRANFAKAFKAGAKVSYGTDAGVYPHGDNAKQLNWMVKMGLTPMQAIQSATRVSADALGMAGTVGVIAPGAAADLIAVDGDPLTDVKVLETVSFVMKGGKVIKSNGAAVAGAF